MKAPLILIISEKMDSNKKQERYEDRLIRMGEAARNNLGLKDEKSIELWPDGSTQDRINRSKVLEIFQAYSIDLKKAKESNPAADYDKIGFVTTKTFNFICKDKRRKKKNIWIADTIEDTVIGADPEFLLMNNDGKIRYAAHVAGFYHEDQLGSDGPWAEIRPDPAIDVSDFIDNIQEILKHHKNTEAIQEYQWLGGCYYYGQQIGGASRSWPLGGHIHIGSPARLARATASFGDHYKESVYACLDKILDEYVAIPAIKIDGKEDSRKRRSEFGEFGDVRLDHDRLEYRMLSGEWLTHPEMAKIVIGTVKAISHAFFRILDEADYKHSMIMTDRQQSSKQDNDFKFYSNGFDGWKNIEIVKHFGAIKSSAVMHKMLDNSDVKFDKPFFMALKRKFRALSTYKDYSGYLDKFIELVSLPNKMLADRDKELRHTWVEESKFIL